MKQKNQNTDTQTKLSTEIKEINEWCVSRVDPNTASRETENSGKRGTTHNDINTDTNRGQPWKGNQKTGNYNPQGNKHRNRGGHPNVPEKLAESYGPILVQYTTPPSRTRWCLLIDELVLLPTQLWQTVLDSLHLTHPGSAAVRDLCQYIWFPHIHRSIEPMTQGCQKCTEQGKNSKTKVEKNTHSKWNLLSNLTKSYN